MNLRSLLAHLGFPRSAGQGQPFVNSRLRDAAFNVVERLEQRQLLSTSPLASAHAAAATVPAVVAKAGIAFKAVKGQTTGPVVVATFTDPGGAEPLGNYSATVIWGDGSQPDDNAIIESTGPDAFSVVDSHTYAQEDAPFQTGGTPYSVRVTVHKQNALDTPSVYTYHTLDSKSAAPTSNYGINNSRVVTGLVQNTATSDNSGVLFNNGAETSINLPGAQDTETYQINDQGQIAVSFFGTSGIYHAAVYDSVHKSWTILPDVPGEKENLSGGINDNGLIVGDTFTNSSFQGGQGWTFQGNHYALFTAPGSDPGHGGTATYSVNNAGQIVGYVFDSKGVEHGYLKTGATFTLLNGPGATSTIALGINNEGIVTGSYDAGGVQHGFLWQNGAFTTLDYPGASGTYITSINDNGDLAGLYFDKSGNAHGFEVFNTPAVVSNTAVTTAMVAELPVIGFALPNAANPVRGVSTGPVALAGFIDPGGAEAASAYSATVTFHDGTAAAAGTIVYNGATGYFTVTAAHIYSSVGTFTPPTITITHGATQTVVYDLNKVTVLASKVAAPPLA